MDTLGVAVGAGLGADARRVFVPSPPFGASAAAPATNATTASSSTTLRGTLTTVPDPATAR
jgi:hypothetical protein